MGTPDWMATGIWLLGWDGKYIYISSRMVKYGLPHSTNMVKYGVIN
jgi:hypothetical protein